MYMSRTRSASRSGKVEKDILPGVRHSSIHRCIKFEDFKSECMHVCRASAERRELVETERGPPVLSWSQFRFLVEVCLLK